jgi:hypothetical protein
LTPGWPGSGFANPLPDSVLIGRLADKIRGHSLDLGNHIGEGHQLYKLATNTVTRLGRAAFQLKKGNIEGFLKVLGNSSVPKTKSGRNISGYKSIKRKLDKKDVAGAWLEAQYGWLPLYEDVFQVASAFNKLTREPRTQTYKASTSNTGFANSSPSPTIYEYSENRTTSVRLKCTIKEELSAPRSLGLLDPLGVAWEITPWSFAIDWFLPIGAYLDALSVIPHVNVEKVVKSTRKRSVSRYGGLKKYKAGNGTHYEEGDVRLFYERLSLQRTVSSSITIPKPKFQNPFAALMRGKRLENAIALAVQLFTKR